MRNQYLIETLSGIDFLDGFSEDDVEQLAKVAKVCDFDAYETVFPEGAVADSVYLVVSGKVSLEICAPSVGCKRILTVGAGEVLGWSGLLHESRLTATARALEPTRVVRLDSAQLLALCERDTRFGYELMRRAMAALATRLNATRMQLLDVYGTEFPTVNHPGAPTNGR